MTETTTVTLPRQTLNLNLGALKTITWLESNPVVEDVTVFTKKQFEKAKEYRLIDIIYSLIIFQLTWLYTLIHTIPWPSWTIQLLHRVDDVVEGVLESVYQRLEWWWDYITINLMRTFESVVIYLDKFITFVDNVIGWLLQKYDWVFDIIQKAYATARGLCLWYIGLWLTAWDYLMTVVTNLQQMWTVSQEELQNSRDDQYYKVDDNEPLPLPETTTPRTRRSHSLPVNDMKRLSFSGVEEIEDVMVGNGCLHSRSSRQSRSDSDGSDVAGVQETRKLLVDEQTGLAYNRVHTEATVVGKQRAIMCQRVTSRLKLMRKNSIRFSRGMDVRVSKMIGTFQNKLTPRSIMSLLLSLIEFIILFPFKVVMWLVGGKRLSRRSRSMRSESTRRREAAAAAAASEGLAPLLGPAALMQSAEPAFNRQTGSLRNSKVKEEEMEGLSDLNRRDSGVSEDNPDSSEESNHGAPILPDNTSANVIFHPRNEKYLSLSSNSTISEEPNEEESQQATPSPPPTPSTLLRKRCKFPSGDLDLSPPEQVTSEPDLRSSAYSSEQSSTSSSKSWKRRSIGATPDDVLPIDKKRVKKRVTYDINYY